MNLRLLLAALMLCCLAGHLVAQTTPIAWSQALRQKPEWYSSDEAVRVADNVLIYQRSIGGWPKNIDMAKPFTPAEKAGVLDAKEQNDALIDNGATYTQMTYLARVYQAKPQERCKSAFLLGLDYLLKMQYENGGWPQYYPRLTGYYKHITFNDDAMIGVLTILRDIARKEAVYAFVGDARRRKAERGVQKGIECILKCQIKVNGKLTAWCAQHDEVTFAPAPARTYEKISLSGSESVGIVRFLMEIEKPSPAIVTSIEAAVAWLSQVKITGIKVVEQRDAALPNGRDRIVVQDANAAPLWARFYDLNTNRPIFCGRDGIIKYSLAEIEYERRNGYRWYVNQPAELLSRDYPAWQKRLSGKKASLR